jgi:iron complex transport system ATP-binding protein
MTLPAGPPLLEFRHVTILRGLKPALDDVSISIPAGEHVAILGPNGCGKSTFVKAITRECYPLARTGSSIRIFGREVWNVFDLRSHLGIVSNDLASIYARDISGTEAVLSGFFSSIGIWSNHQVTEEMRSKAAELLAHLEVSHLAERSMSEMSSGEARRILLCRALVHNPQALLLDEPSTSLDLHAQRELTSDLQRLARSGVTILLVTHSGRHNSGDSASAVAEKRTHCRRWDQRSNSHLRSSLPPVQLLCRHHTTRRVLSRLVTILVEVARTLVSSGRD